MLAQAQGVAGHASGVASGHRDQHPMSVGHHLRRRLQTLGAIHLFRAPPAADGEQFVYPIQGRLSRGFVVGPDDDDQVVGSGGFCFGGQQVALGQNLFVGIRAHHHPGVQDARQVVQRTLQLHKNHGVVISAGSDLRFRYRHGNLLDGRMRIGASGWIQKQRISLGHKTTSAWGTGTPQSANDGVRTL